MKVVSITQTCDACPSQWEGITEDRRKVYVRYRWGYLSVCVGEIGDMSEDAAVGGKEIVGLTVGEGLDGVLDYSELKEITKEEIMWPDEDNNSGE